MLDIFPILCYYDTYTEPLLIEYLFDIIKSGEADQVRLIIDSFGININVSNTSKYNLFEQAAFSCQYETMKMLYEEYGLTSNLGYLLENAARMDRPDILEYL